MKPTNQLMKIVVILLLFVTNVTISQEEQQYFITVTTMHWNMDKDDFNMDEWKAVEKEYLDKVTMKNEYVLSTAVALHRYTPDNSELLYVQVFDSWEAIDKAADRDGELIRAAWPDQAARRAYFEKRNDYYADKHSDEIYVTMSGTKEVSGIKEGDEIIYAMRKSRFAFPKEGSGKEFNELRDEYVKNVIHKNEYFKGYYPHAHMYGSDRRDYIEVFVVTSMDDLDKGLDNNGKLFREHWSDETARKEFGEKASKYFTGWHADYIYTGVPEISKPMAPQ
ncbi:hypothetical protein [Leptobacterium sp. I13]|uniref:hypothetical protein n=1 Tax=Leptobacterium meishanense TaxID=3128904 RepID=UPI0030EBBC35